MRGLIKNASNIMLLATFCLLLFGGSAATAVEGAVLDPVFPSVDWPSNYGSAGNNHYSPLKQINRSNLLKLKEVWRYDTGEKGGLETTPVVIDGVLYALTPSQKVIALNAVTGKLIWSFDSQVIATGPNRGLTFWSQSGEHRLFAGIMNFLFALDPMTGKLLPSFGDHGRIDLRENLGREAAKQSVALTSPGVIFEDLIIVGGREPEALPAPPGDVRAYDVRTGKLRWSFHTIPHPGEFGYETWPEQAWQSTGAANNWAGMAVDSEHGIVYVPTGSAASDFYGGDRKGDDLFADTLIALDARTGKRIWHFQGVHHDLWDRDFPSAPTLLTIHRNGQNIPAIAQPTKQGILFVFNRLTGEPLFPIEDKPVTQSIVPGEATAKSQPYPVRPAPYARQEITAATLTNRSPEAHRWALEQFNLMQHTFPYAPFRLGQGTLIMPSFEGGGEWGGAGVDPDSGVLYINANDYASIGGLAAHVTGNSGRSTYLSQCSACHGQDRTGAPPAFPSLVQIKLSAVQVALVVHQGRGRMPAFPNLEGSQLKRLLDYIETGKDDSVQSAGEPDLKNTGIPANQVQPRVQYTMTGYRRFLDPEGYPAVAPPWGTLNAIDLNTGEYLWKRPLGEYPELAAKGMADTGSENYGGPLVTAGGLVFIGATNFDRKFRAFDKQTGKLLWETTLPFPGNATPATYQVAGRQYVVIAAGGSSLMIKKESLGGVYVAYALSK